jgi:hypothetical protein
LVLSPLPLRLQLLVQPSSLCLLLLVQLLLLRLQPPPDAACAAGAVQLRNEYRHYHMWYRLFVPAPHVNKVPEVEWDGFWSIDLQTAVSHFFLKVQ